MKKYFAFLIIATAAAAQCTPDQIVTERAKLLDGVTMIPKHGAPGPLALWGGGALPVVSAADGDGVETVLVATAGYEKGRVVLFGHNAYLNGDSTEGGARLLSNVVTWAAGKAKPDVGLFGEAVRGIWKDGPLKTTELREISKDSLRRLDVLVINANRLNTDEAAEATMDFLKSGGGVVAAMTGWAYEQLNPGKQLAVHHPLVRAMQPVGLNFTEDSTFGAVNQFAARNDLPQFLNAHEVVEAMGGRQKLAPSDMKQMSSSIRLAMSVQSGGESPFQTTVLTALSAGNARKSVPTKQSPLEVGRHDLERMRLGVEAQVLRAATGESVGAHPAHEYFPGKVAPATPRGKGEVTIDPAVTDWASTGWYAAAGEVIEITLPEAMADKGFAVRIGCHTDRLYHLEKWERAPEITRLVPLSSAVTRTSSAFGGLIYIVTPDRFANETPAKFEVTIGNAIAAPLFVLGVDDDQSWNEQIKRRPAPWAEFACDKLVLSCPSEVARKVNNPTQLMQFWKAVVEAQDDLCNQANERRRPERIVADVQISAGYMHSGYPIMIPTSAAAEMVTFNPLQFPGWGFYHELGHNHQRPWFTFDGTVEVTCNVIGMYCYHTVLKKDWLIGHTEVSPEARKRHVASIKKSADKWQTWKSSPFVALETYIQLVEEFGWESWKTYLHSFADESLGAKPKGDVEARDQFLIRYSKITKKNLGPFFDFCGIPVSDQAKAAVANLEPWMPDDL